jgi:hypothetical protein
MLAFEGGQAFELPRRSVKTNRRHKASESCIGHATSH